MRVSAGLIGGLLLAALSSASAGPAHAASPELVAAATKEGQVVWYTSFPAAPVRALVGGFERRYPGIKVRPAVSSQNDIVLRVIDESRAGRVQADIAHGTATFGPLKRSGNVECHLPDSARSYPAELRDSEGCWAAQVLFFSGMALNTQAVPEADRPKTAEDLLDPKWQGRLAWSAQMTPGSAAGFIGGVLASMGPEEGRRYLGRLAGQRLISVPANPRAVLDQVIAGQFPVTLTSFNQHSLISSKLGAPVRWLAVQPIWASIDVVYLIKGGPNPNAARLFMDYILSDDGQRALRDADSIPASPAIAASAPELKPEGGGFKAVMFRPEDIDAGLPEWTKLYDELFK